MSPTHDTEARVRAAMQRAAARVDVDDFGSLDRIRERTVTAQKRRRVVATGAGLAMAVVAVAVGVSFMRDGRSGVTIAPAGTGEQQPTTTTSGTTEPGPTTSSSIDVPAPPTPPAGSVFPASVDDASDDPVETVHAFLAALDYGRSYGLDGEESSDGETATAHILAENENGTTSGPPRTTVSLERSRGLWYVMGAASPEIEVESPAPGAAIASPITVSGRGRGYEAQLVVTVHDAELRPLTEPSLDSGLPLAGCCTELEPFSTDISFAGEPGPGAVVVRNMSGVDDGAASITVVPVVLAPAGTTTVQVYLLRGEEPVAVTRTVPHTTGVLNAAIGQLLAAPTAEEVAAGLTSMFSSKTAGTFYEVNVQTDGTAVVQLDHDLSELIPEASTSAGSAAVLAQLNGTVFQFPNILRVDYRMGSDCEPFWIWLQRDCEIVPRPE